LETYKLKVRKMAEKRKKGLFEMRFRLKFGIHFWLGVLHDSQNGKNRYPTGFALFAGHSCF
jgi:hypothetical protein